MQRFLRGKGEFSIKVIQGHFKTRMVTELAICPESSVAMIRPNALGANLASGPFMTRRCCETRQLAALAVRLRLIAGLYPS
jgi:hypothetical protein